MQNKEKGSPATSGGRWLSGVVVGYNAFHAHNIRKAALGPAEMKEGSVCFNAYYGVYIRILPGRHRYNDRR